MEEDKTNTTEEIKQTDNESLSDVDLRVRQFGHGKKYSIVYVDPPWKYNDPLGSSSAKMGACEYHYNTMSIEELCNLPVGDLADKDCALFMWATFPKLNEVFKVIEAWGFTYKTVAFVWIKLNPKSKTIFKGIGRWVQGNAEIVLFATKGKLQRINKNVPQVILAERGEHSRKPDEAKERIIKLLGELPRIELFARDREPLFAGVHDGWDRWGNETQNSVELVPKSA